MQVKAENFIVFLYELLFLLPFCVCVSPCQDLICCYQLVQDHLELVYKLLYVCVSVMEALKKKHKEELEREVEKVRRLSSGVMDSQALRVQQQ